MEPYRPKRFEIHKYYREGQHRTVCFSLAKETYDLITDYYIHVGLWYFGFTVVLFRAALHDNK